MPYTKLFNSIITSSLWLEPDQTRLVWITMLAIADKNGEVQASVPGLARLAGVTIEGCESALKALLSPDPHSRTKVLQGRRIVEIDGGWELVNYAKYRRMASEEDAREANAKRQSRHRARMEEVTESNAMSQERNAMSRCSNGDVTPDDHKQRQKAEADSEEKAEKKKKKAKPEKVCISDIAPLLPEQFQTEEFKEQWQGFIEHRKMKKAPLTEIAVKMFASDFIKWGPRKTIEAIKVTVKGGKWTGIFEQKDIPNEAPAPLQATPEQISERKKAEQRNEEHMDKINAEVWAKINAYNKKPDGDGGLEFVGYVED